MRDLWRIRDEIIEMLGESQKDNQTYWWLHHKGLMAAFDLIEAAITEREVLSLRAAGYSE